MEINSKGQRLISVVRVIEYHGTAEWVTEVLQASRVPVQGVTRFSPEDPTTAFPEGHEIKSGIVNWEIIGEDGLEKGPATPVIPIPPAEGRVM